MKSLFSILLLTFSLAALAECEVFNSDSSKVESLGDALFQTLKSQSSCPENVFELKDQISSLGFDIAPSMVANRGRHNSKFGSFSFFEIVSGFSNKLNLKVKKDEFFFGHFTGAAGGEVGFDQSPRPGKLLIELIVWDQSKQMYNFYELIGTSTAGTWFYRGDSKDAIQDNINLHLQKDPSNPKFGRTMRCSACHTSGGPIMKEIELPHNDWWTTKRILPFGQNKPTKQVEEELAKLIDANEFSKVVKSGISKLAKSSKLNSFKSSLSLKQSLKPLFCTQEINLISDEHHFDSPMKEISIKSDYWVNPLLVASKSLNIDKQEYIKILQGFNISFPEINRLDADHAWLAPVKSHADLTAINTLIKSSLIDEEFAIDVLSIDMENPLFSSKRCGLLNQVPEFVSESWINEFKKNLSLSRTEEAVQLVSSLNKINKEEIKNKANEYIASIEEQLTEPSFIRSEFINLHRNRVSVFNNEISKNPMGQILEPGFRVIFPMPN